MEVTTELLPCPLCSLPHFKDVHSLRSTLISAATTKLICPVCKESILGLDKLTIHLFSHMSSSTSRKENRESHFKVGVTEYINKVNENSPIEKINPIPIDVESDTVICQICDFTFNDQTILELHKKLIHPNNADKESGIYNFHCHLCTKKFKMRGSLMVHLRVAHYGFSGSTAKKNTIEMICNTNKEVLPKQWECDICCKMFTTKYFLKKHKRLHTGEMPYTCSQCNKSFTFQQSYHKHMLYHSSEKPHTCMECGRCFKELSTLQNHARIHSGERPFICETCGKSFRQRVSYLVHQRIHTGAMPYDCERCGKKFRYKVSQRSHKCVPISPSKISDNTIHCQHQLQPNQNTDSSKEQRDSTFCSENRNDLLSNKDNFPNCLTTDENDYQFTFPTAPIESDKKKKHRIEVSTSSAHDLYSIILSPLPSDVELLCLSNSTLENSTGVSPIKKQYNSENIFSSAHFLQENK